MEIKLRNNIMTSSISKTLLIDLGIVLFFVAGAAKAQPAYYYEPAIDSSGIAKMYRFNFATGVEELFLSGYDPGTSALKWDQTQTWLYYWSGNDPQEGPITLINIANPTFRKVLPDGNVQAVMGVKYVPQLNRIYIATESENYIYDAATLQCVDSLSEDQITVFENYFLSEDGTILYFRHTDPKVNKSSLAGFSLISKSIVSSRPISEIGPPAIVKNLVDAKRGKAVFGYDYPSRNRSDGHYLLYDATRDTFFTPIPFSIVSNDAHLSGDAKYFIVQETPVNPDRDPKTPRLLTGRISIFDAAKGNLKSKLTLPKGGTIFAFENYPNVFYYFNTKEKKSINIDLSKLTTISSISPATILAGSGKIALTVAGSNFTVNSKILLNGVNRTTTFIADSLLVGTIRGDDDSASTTAYISVKGDVATTDSLTLNIVSVPPQTLNPILDCITQQDDTTYTAWFGYENTDTISITVPVGAQNKFTPEPNDRTQPIVFDPGRKDKIFSIVFNGKNLTWKLNGNEVVASKKSPKCN